MALALLKADQKLLWKRPGQSFSSEARNRFEGMELTHMITETTVTAKANSAED